MTIVVILTVWRLHRLVTCIGGWNNVVGTYISSVFSCVQQRASSGISSCDRSFRASTSSSPSCITITATTETNCSDSTWYPIIRLLLLANNDANDDGAD
jgi:hypothetical protein